MTVGELIKELEQLDKNLTVEVQYRDGGGEYMGTDDELYLMIINGVLIL